MSTNSASRRYLLRHRLGEGAFGEVYLAELDSGAGFRRKVAIKLLHQAVEARSKDAGRRMRDEARILGRLAHRNVVGVLDLVQLEGRWAVVMDYVPGADLAEVIRALDKAGRTFPGPAALEAGVAMLNGLSAVHSAVDEDGASLGLIHRDIKPSNVRLTTDGEIKVLDFGVARVDMDVREARTESSGWIGTELYMAPERILMRTDSPAGDVYAAAATVVECILGRPLGRTPVIDEEHTPLVHRALDDCRTALEGELSTIRDVQHWLFRALATQPDDRPSARELADALEPLSRALEGDSLAQFSRSFLPTIDNYLDRQLVPAEGTLVEDIPEALLSGGTNPTFGGLDDLGDEALPVSATVDFTAASSAGDASVSVTPSSVDANRRPAWWSLAALASFVSLSAVAAIVSVLAVIAFSLRSDGSGNPLPEGEPPPTATEAIASQPPAIAAPAEPEPEPVAQPAPTPRVATPQPTPEPVVPAPEPEPVVPAPEPAPSGETIRRALFSLPNASRLSVRCGTVEATGTRQADLRSFPAGTCTVEADVAGTAHTTRVEVLRACTVRCDTDGGDLQCTCS